MTGVVGENRGQRRTPAGVGVRTSGTPRRSSGMPSAIFYTTEMVAYGMGHRGASSRPGVIVGPRPSDRGSARRCRAWRRRRCTSQHPTSPSTSLTSYVGQEIIVANNTVCSSCLTSWSPGRPGSRDVPVMWLALSEFHYCRHNSCSVELCLWEATYIQGKSVLQGW